jgi:hypothetical protein
MHHIQATPATGPHLDGSYLQGPRTPQKVKRDGYGFTADIEQAWPFSSHISATAKARIVCRHMSWPTTHLTVIPETQDNKTQDTRQ